MREESRYRKELLPVADAGGPAPERPEPPPAWLSRRGFLRAAGFALPAALAACHRAPVERAIPLLVQPEGVVPGTALWFASTCRACEAGCGLLVKSRDGRPIKVEGNPEHPVSRGGVCARGQASVLELYDGERLAGPLVRGREATWEEADREVAAALEAASRRGAAVRLLTGTLSGPTARRWIGRFLARFPDARHVAYDPISVAAIPAAHAVTHGVRALPRLRLERAEVIVGLDADFLGAWLSPVELTAGWRRGRSPSPEAPRMSYHVQVETHPTVTGAKADRRWPVRPSQLGPALAALAAAVARRAGEPAPAAPVAPPLPAAELEALADRLWAARGRAVVVCGVNDLAMQVVCARLNAMLDAYGSTLDLERPSYQALGDDAALAGLLAELEAGRVGVLVVAGANPVYDLAGVADVAGILRSVPFVVTTSRWLDETARLATVVCPDHHPLESWDDVEPVAGVVGVVQPLVAPLGGTRQLVESLAAWSGSPRPAHELVRETWREEVHPRAAAAEPFERFWSRALQRGFVEVEPAAGERVPAAPAPGPVRLDAGRPEGFELVAYAPIAVGDGRHALNPWLQELPDPVTKVTWDNVAVLAPEDAARLGVREGDVVRVEVPGRGAVELPAFPHPGQPAGAVAVALGYGRAGTERFQRLGPRWIRAQAPPPGPVGASVEPLLGADRDGLRRRVVAGVRVTPTGRSRPLACTQTHHSLEVPERLRLPGGERRDAVREVTLGELEGAPPAEAHEEPSLWPDDHPYTGHHWALVVDLNACTGCSACVVSCQAENNVPVVGRDEVRRTREMHWIRIDAYYAGSGSDLRVVYQPMMCQQCDNAPCETVCPVLATVHSEEGLSEQVYNRCIGTRYCANNCPYKVRRFNWFDYHKQPSRTDLALNPDVTVRSRGVMEKCTFCVQRIAEAKVTARARGRELADGDIRVACEQSCPAGAIVFGDLNDPESRVARLVRDPRRYRVLEELGVRPSVYYLAVVRHEGVAEEEVRHG